MVSLVVTGCGLNSYMTARKSPRDLRYESDASLCDARRHWRTPQVMNEISRRRLNCTTGVREPGKDRSSTARTAKPDNSPGGNADPRKQAMGGEVSAKGAGVDLDALDSGPAAEDGQGLGVREPAPGRRDDEGAASPGSGGVDLDR